MGAGRGRAGSRNPGLRRLLISLGVWIAADWALLIGLSVVAYDAGGAAAVGLVGALRVFPGAVLGPLLAAGTDRLPRPLVLGCSHAALAVVALALVVVTGTGASLPVLLTVVTVGSVLAAAFKPTASALLPQLVTTPEDLVGSNAAWGTVEAGGTLAGPVLSGVLLATVDPAALFGVLAGLYVVAVVVSLTIRTDFQPGRRTRSRGLDALLEPLRGFPALAVRPGVRVIFWLYMGQTAVRGFLNVYVVVLAAQVAGSVGGLFAAMGVGGLAGAAVAVALPSAARNARRSAIGVLLWGAPLVVLGAYTAEPVAYLALAVIGLGNALEDSYGYSMLHRLLPDEVAGRAWGAYHSVGAGAVAVGSLAAPLLIDLSGLSWAMVLTGGLLALAPLVLWPRLRTLDATTEVAGDQLDLLRGVPALAPMPTLVQERLVRSARAVSVEDGTVLIREGEPGRTFYVIAAGQVAVHQAAGPLRRLGPGDSFGEIALLRGVPRTATVTADGPVRLLAVDLQAFVGAVTSHRGATEVAEETVRHLLATRPTG